MFILVDVRLQTTFVKVQAVFTPWENCHFAIEFLSIPNYIA